MLNNLPERFSQRNIRYGSALFWWGIVLIWLSYLLAESISWTSYEDYVLARRLVIFALIIVVIQIVSLVIGYLEIDLSFIRNWEILDRLVDVIEEGGDEQNFQESTESLEESGGWKKTWEIVISVLVLPLMIYLFGTFLGATAFIGLFVLYYVRDITTTVLSVVIYVLVYRILFIEVLGVITYSGLLL